MGRGGGSDGGGMRGGREWGGEGEVMVGDERG